MSDLAKPKRIKVSAEQLRDRGIPKLVDQLSDMFLDAVKSGSDNLENLKDRENVKSVLVDFLNDEKTGKRKEGYVLIREADVDKLVDGFIAEATRKVTEYEDNKIKEVEIKTEDRFSDFIKLEGGRYVLKTDDEDVRKDLIAEYLDRLGVKKRLIALETEAFDKELQEEVERLNLAKEAAKAVVTAREGRGASEVGGESVIGPETILTPAGQRAMVRFVSEIEKFIENEKQNTEKWDIDHDLFTNEDKIAKLKTVVEFDEILKQEKVDVKKEGFEIILNQARLFLTSAEQEEKRRNAKSGAEAAKFNQEQKEKLDAVVAEAASVWKNGLVGLVAEGGFAVQDILENKKNLFLDRDNVYKVTNDSGYDSVAETLRRVLLAVRNKAAAEGGKKLFESEYLTEMGLKMKDDTTFEADMFIDSKIIKTTYELRDFVYDMVVEQLKKEEEERKRREGEKGEVLKEKDRSAKLGNKVMGELGLVLDIDPTTRRKKIKDIVGDTMFNQMGTLLSQVKTLSEKDDVVLTEIREKNDELEKLIKEIEAKITASVGETAKLELKKQEAQKQLRLPRQMLVDAGLLDDNSEEEPRRAAIREAVGEVKVYNEWIDANKDLVRVYKKKDVSLEALDDAIEKYNGVLNKADGVKDRISKYILERKNNVPTESDMQNWAQFLTIVNGLTGNTVDMGLLPDDTKRGLMEAEEKFEKLIQNTDPTSGALVLKTGPELASLNKREIVAAKVDLEKLFDEASHLVNELKMTPLEKAKRAHLELNKIIDTWLSSNGGIAAYDGRETSLVRECGRHLDTLKEETDKLEFTGPVEMYVGQRHLKGGTAVMNLKDLYSVILIEKITDFHRKNKEARSQSLSLVQKIKSSARSTVAAGLSVATFGGSQYLSTKFDRIAKLVEGNEARDFRVLNARLRLLERNERNISKTAQFWNRWQHNYDNLSLYEKAQYNIAYSSVAALGFFTFQPQLVAAGVVKSAWMQFGLYSLMQTAVPTVLRFKGTLDKERIKSNERAFNKALGQATLQFGISACMGVSLGPIIGAFFHGVSEEVLYQLSQTNFISSAIAEPVGGGTLVPEPARRSFGRLRDLFGGGGSTQTQQVENIVDRINNAGLSGEDRLKVVAGLTPAEITSLGESGLRRIDNLTAGRFLRALTPGQISALSAEQLNYIYNDAHLNVANLQGATRPQYTRQFLSSVNIEELRKIKLVNVVGASEDVNTKEKQFTILFNRLFQVYESDPSKLFGRRGGWLSSQVTSPLVEIATNSGISSHDLNILLAEHNLTNNNGVLENATLAAQAPIRSLTSALFSIDQVQEWSQRVDIFRRLVPAEIPSIRVNEIEDLLKRFTGAAGNQIGILDIFSNQQINALTGPQLVHILGTLDRERFDTRNVYLLREINVATLRSYFENRPNELPIFLVNANLEIRDNVLVPRSVPVVIVDAPVNPAAPMPRVVPAPAPAPAGGGQVVSQGGGSATQGTGGGQAPVVSGSRSINLDDQFSTADRRMFSPGRVTQSGQNAITLERVPSSQAVWAALLKRQMDAANLTPSQRVRFLEMFDAEMLQKAQGSSAVRRDMARLFGVRGSGDLDTRISRRTFKLEDFQRLFRTGRFDEPAMNRLIRMARRTN